MYTPVTTEAFATYGVVDDGAIAQPVQTPAGVVPQYGGLEIDTSSTAMQALTDAVVYLEDYPYESADAYASYNAHPDHVAFVQERWVPEVADFLEIDYEPLAC